ncbi:MAG: sulfite exporter TauE/SafE family protein [Candidatus Falkowbacteria bacterium]|nr:sulfite exporter TauE/SafE family protein [Candidatus Falkowbacteria bacterium]
MEKNYTFYVKGMHCPSCVILTETESKEVAGVIDAKASLDKNTLEISGDFSNETIAETKKRLNESLTKHGYSLSDSPEEQNSDKWAGFNIAIPTTILIIALFIALQKLGLANLIQASSVSYSTAFVIGIVASLSTCMAVVGGLALSLSASFAKQGNSAKPHIMFHAGRLIGFFLLGGLIGVLGGSFQLGAFGTSTLNIIIALVMLGLGINLLNIFSWSHRLQITMPKGLSKNLLQLKSLNTVITPFIIGAVTFFLPCGFTQSMQLYALSTHSFINGAMIMLVFALGTLPILSLISFGSRIAEKLKANTSTLFKTMGLIIICFALFNIINSLAALGIIPPIFNF